MTRRVLLGLAGPPGSGKSTLAARIVDAIDDAVAVPMDGFHRFQDDLERSGLADRKGAPETFDVDGFVAALRTLRDSSRTVWAPAFDRVREDPVPGSIEVRPDHHLVVTEGNYLLLQQGRWADVRLLLDACWYVDVDPAVRLRRLIARHVDHGRTPADAEAWVMRSDEANARLVETTRPRADLGVDPDGDLDPLLAAVHALRSAGDGAAADQTR